MHSTYFLHLLNVSTHHQKKKSHLFFSFLKATFEALCVQPMVQFTGFSFYPFYALHRIGLSQTGQAQSNTTHSELNDTGKNLGSKQQQ